MNFIKNLKFNKEKITSLLLASSIVLTATGCARKDDSPKATNVPITIIETTAEPEVRQEEYLNKYNLSVDLDVLNNDVYANPGEENQYTLFPGANIYYKKGFNIVYEELNENSKIVTIQGIGSKYSIIELPDNRIAYTENTYLIKNPNLHNGEYSLVEKNKDTFLTMDAYLYDINGMYCTVLKKDTPCHMVASNGEYTLITLEDGTNGYVLDVSLMGLYQQIDGYGFISKGTTIYRDKSMKEVYRTSEDEVIQVSFITGRYAAIFDGSTQDYLYVKPDAIKSNFIVVNLNEQRMYCYLDYQNTNTWPTRTGRDSSPTHTGAYDIDAKVSDWEFTTFPGSYAKYWIPIDPDTQEGIHDLVGDDEWNYGNGAYHSYGSHGCMRVPVAASEYVYENYEIGDMVLVRKK